VYIKTEIHRTNQAVLDAALEGAGRTIKSRLLYAIEKEEGVDNNEYLAMSDRPPLSFLKVARKAKLWEKIKEGETEEDRKMYRGREGLYVGRVNKSDDECPEVVGYYFADKAHDDPESTLATRGVTFDIGPDGKEEFKLGGEILTGYSYDTVNGAGKEKIVYIYRVLLDSNKGLNVRAGYTESGDPTGHTWIIEPRAHNNILPIAVVYLEPSAELDRAKDINYEYLMEEQNKYKARKAEEEQGEKGEGEE
jgi:hypothetical protein